MTEPVDCQVPRGPRYLTPPLFQFTLRQLMWFVTWFSVFCGLTASAVKLVQRAREEACVLRCKNNLAQIGLALRLYHQANGALPPAYLLGKDGKPALSWRLLAHYYMDQNHVIDKGVFAYSWNSPQSVGLNYDPTLFSIFRCPSADAKNPRAPCYVAVVGANTMWPGSKSAEEVTDATDGDKILVIEITNSDINWMEPRDLTLEEALNAIQPAKGLGIGSAHARGVHYVTVRGEVLTLDRNIDRESLRKLLTRDAAKRPDDRARADKPRQ
jgi:hypothetical protein